MMFSVSLLCSQLHNYMQPAMLGAVNGRKRHFGGVRSSESAQSEMAWEWKFEKQNEETTRNEINVDFK